MSRKPLRVLELRSVRGTGGGPEKTILLSAARHDPAVVAATVCYIRDTRDPLFRIDVTARQLGVDYVEIPERGSFDPRIWKLLRAVVRDRGIDIVHAHEYKTDLLALCLARAAGIIPVATVHGWSGETWRERAYYYADKKLLSRYPMVIAVSEPIRQTLIECGSDPARVRSIRNGIDHEVFRRVPGLKETTRRALGIPQEGLVIGAVGRIESEKRFDLLLRSAAALAPSLNTFVVIAGGGSLQNDLARLANELGIAGRVKLLGHRDDVIDIHHTFDIYAQTSVREGIPNAVLEAMAVGTPVVATDVGGTSELITDRVHGLLVPFGDCPAMTRAFESIVAHPEDAAARAAAARDRIEHELSFQVRLATIEAIYSELGDRARRGVRTRLEA